MKSFKTFLQTNYHYTDYQIKVMEYFIKPVFQKSVNLFLWEFSSPVFLHSLIISMQQ